MSRKDQIVDFQNSRVDFLYCSSTILHNRPVLGAELSTWLNVNKKTLSKSFIMFEIMDHLFESTGIPERAGAVF